MARCCYICGHESGSWQELAEHIVANKNGHHLDKQQKEWAKEYIAKQQQLTLSVTGPKNSIINKGVSNG